MQPLDIAFFHPSKEMWRSTIIKYRAEKNISRLKKEHLSALLFQALEYWKDEPVQKAGLDHEVKVMKNHL